MQAAMQAMASTSAESTSGTVTSSAVSSNGTSVQPGGSAYLPFETVCSEITKP
jgi:hypothetical protein